MLGFHGHLMPIITRMGRECLCHIIRMRRECKYDIVAEILNQRKCRDVKIMKKLILCKEGYIFPQLLSTILLYYPRLIYALVPITHKRVHQK